MISAHVTHHVEEQVGKPGKKGSKSKTSKRESFRVEIDELHGDGAAKVRRGRSYRLAIPYGEAAISSTCEIELTCNQDKATVMAAARAAIGIADDLLEEDLPYMEDFIRKALK